MPKKTRTATSNAESRKHEVVDAWLKVARPIGGGQPLEVSLLKDRGHSCVYRLEGAGPGGTGVIAKRCTQDGAEIESTVYRDILACLMLPVLQFYGWIEIEGEADGGLRWLFMEDGGEEKYSYSSPEHRLLAGRWLGMIHCGTASLAAPPCLPQRGSGWYLDKLRSLRVSLLGSLANPALKDDDVGILEAVLLQCELLESRWHDLARLCEGMPQTLTHGDLSPKNTRLRAGRGGPSLFAIDWETASWGVPAIDLGSLSPDLAAYLSVIQPAFAEARAVEQMALAGQLFRLIISMGWEEDSLASPWPGRAISHMRFYEEQLARSIQECGWGAA